MQICTRRDAFARDLEAGRRPKCLLKLREICKAGLLRRFCAKQRPERSAVNGADRGVLPDGKDQGLDVGAPAYFLVQVETMRLGRLVRVIGDPFPALWDIRRSSHGHASRNVVGTRRTRGCFRSGTHLDYIASLYQSESIAFPSPTQSIAKSPEEIP